MSAEVTFIQLQDICTKVCSGGTPSTRNKDFYSGGVIPWVKTKEVKNNKIDKVETYITEEALVKSSAKLIPSNSVIVAMYGNGDTAGRVAINKIPLATNQACCNLIIDPEKSDYRFVFYYLRTQYQRLVDLKNGGAQQNLNAGMLKEYPFPNFRRVRQVEVADVLEGFDDKIELNRQTNQTLEQIAQAIFKSWFVDFEPTRAKIAAKKHWQALNQTIECSSPTCYAEQFDKPKQNNTSLEDTITTAAMCVISGKTEEQLKNLSEETQQQLKTTAALFPDALVESELGDIPEGWGITGFKTIVKKYIDNRGKTPPVVDSGIPLLEVKHLPDGSVKPDLNTTKFVDDETYNNWFRAHLEAEDIIISTVGTIGRICMVPKNEKFTIAQNLLGIRFNKEKAAPYFMYYQMGNYRFHHDVDARLIITVQASIKRKDLETIDLLLPPVLLQNKFDDFVKPFVVMQQSNQEIELAKTRDTLLPKLLSGELSSLENNNTEITKCLNG